MSYNFNCGWDKEPTQQQIQEWDDALINFKTNLFRVIKELTTQIAPTIEISAIEFFGDGIHLDNYVQGFYRAKEKKIWIDRCYLDDYDELIKIVIHELAHAYQHQILYDYYVWNVKNTSNECMHDKLFYEIQQSLLKVYENKTPHANPIPNNEEKGEVK